jgi:orotidine-5'-phosphate decarboxylase
MTIALETRSGTAVRDRVPTRERLIVALDLPSVEEAEALVKTLGDSVWFYKLGLELFMDPDFFKFVDRLKEADKKVFADLKFFDIPETVAKAVKQLAKHGVSFATVHGQDSMLRRACEAKNGIRILAVTVLTSLDEADMRDLGFEVDIAAVVLSRARRAAAVGCDGVIASGREAEAIRRELGDRLLIVVPGIRPGLNDMEAKDDQKRTVDVEEAFNNGADYIVVGRPITRHSDPRAEAERIQARIAAATS